MKIWGHVPAGAKALRQDGRARQERRREEEGARVRRRADVGPSACHPWGLKQGGDSRALLPGLDETRFIWRVEKFPLFQRCWEQAGRPAVSGMRSRSPGPRSWVRGGEWARPGRDCWAGAGRDFSECHAWPVVFVWLAEGTSQADRLPVTAERMSAARRLHRVTPLWL